jgi:hypothetical protein
MIRNSTPKQDVERPAPGGHKAKPKAVSRGEAHLSQGLLVHGSTVPSNRHGGSQLLGTPQNIIEEREENTMKFLKTLAPGPGGGIDPPCPLSFQDPL